MIDSEKKLIAAMTTPTPEVVEAVGQLDGDILILGVAGKLGPTLAELLLRAGARRVIGVSRFSDTAVESYLQEIGVETVRGDLLSSGTLAALPTAP